MPPALYPRIARRAAAWIDYLLPPACAGCGGNAAEEVRGGEGPVCRNCRLGLPRVPEPACSRCGAPMGTGEAPSCLECADWPALLDHARAVCMLQSPARELVHALKYQGWRTVGDFMGQEMARRATPAERQAGCVIPVPTSERNLRRRGYNQAGIIAHALARELDLPVVAALGRQRQRGTQTVLNPMERRANVSGAFSLVPSLAERVAGQRVLLVDDVITTGATILAAVRALEPAAPASISGCAFARTVPIANDHI